MAMQRATKEQDWLKFITQLGWDKDKFALSYAQEERKIAQKDKELSGDFGGRPREVKKEDIPQYNLEKVIGDTQTLAAQIKQTDSEFIKTKGKDQEWLDTQRLAWEKNPYGVDTEVADHFNISERERRTVESNYAMAGDIDRLAFERFGDIRKLIPNDAPVQHTTREGVTHTYSPEDFVNYTENVAKYIIPRTGVGGGAGSGTKYDTEGARKGLSSKEFHLFQIQSGAAPDTRSEGLFGSTGALLGKLQYYNKIVNIPYKDVVRERNKFTAQEVTNRITSNQGVSYTVNAENAAQRSRIATVLADYADIAESQKDKIANSDFDKDAARKIAASSNAVYSFTITEGTEYQPAMYSINATGESGGETFSTSLKLTPEQKVATFGSMFEPSPAVREFRPYQDQIRKMGGKTTAKSPGTSNHTNAYLGKIDFPGVEVYGVKANITKSAKSGLYSLRLSAYDPIKEKWYEDIPVETELLREDQVIPMIRGLKDADVFELLNEFSPSAEDLKRVKEASKKPL